MQPLADKLLLLVNYHLALGLVERADQYLS